MIEIEAKLREKVKALLEKNRIKYFIGYEKGSDPFHCTPVFVKDIKNVDRLTWNRFCMNNLVTFLIEEKKRELKRGEKPDKRPIGIFVKGCDSKALVQLISENKIQRDEVVIYSVPCKGVISSKKIESFLKEKKLPASAYSQLNILGETDLYTIKYNSEKYSVSKNRVILDKCKDCTTPNPLIYDELFGEKIQKIPQKNYSTVEDVEGLSLEKRWEFFSEHFKRCIRCSACRNVCPICYCKECVVDEANLVITPKTTYKEKANKRVWIEKNVDLPENLFFHLTRMLHMAGRCTNCGECERVCPMNIPLNLITKKLEKEVKEMFDYESGLDTEAKPLLSIFEEDDPGDFIK